MVRSAKLQFTGTKHMASARKNSNSKSRSTSKRRIAKPPARESVSLAAAGASAYAICIQNEGYEASLELRKLYPVLEDNFGSQHGMIRVIDESGEDYLFPNEYFVPVTLSQAVEKQLRKIA